MLILLRIAFGLALAYGFQQVVANAHAAPETGDLTNAFYLAVCVILAVANAIVWAPYFGEKLSDPIAGILTRGTYMERRNHLLRLIRWFDRRGDRRAAAFFCFVEGVLHPDWPTPFVLGMKNSRSGSWLERVFARELFRFDNAQHCTDAYHILRRHGLDPRPHHNPEINLLLISLEREVKPPPDRIAVPEAPDPPPLRRNRRIHLFQAADPPRTASAATPRSTPALESDVMESTEPGRPQESVTEPPPASVPWIRRLVIFLKEH